MIHPDLRQQARTAYEHSRLRLAGLHALPALFPLLVIWLSPHRTTAQLFGAVALFAVAVGLVWRGGAAARAVRPALSAGLLPLLLPLIVFQSFCGSGNCTTNCIAACTLAGAGAGAWIGLQSAHQRQRLEFGITGGILVVWTGALGCSALGAVELFAMALAFAAVAAPLAIAGPAVRRT